MEASKCKICGKMPRFEISPNSDGRILISCVEDLTSDNPHYINMIGDTEQEAITKWEMLMAGTVN